jgi:hypothetical protein
MTAGIAPEETPVVRAMALRPFSRGKDSAPDFRSRDVHEGAAVRVHRAFVFGVKSPDENHVVHVKFGAAVVDCVIKHHPYSVLTNAMPVVFFVEI